MAIIFGRAVAAFQLRARSRRVSRHLYVFLRCPGPVCIWRDVHNKIRAVALHGAAASGSQLHVSTPSAADERRLPPTGFTPVRFSAVVFTSTFADQGQELEGNGLTPVASLRPGCTSDRLSTEDRLCCHGRQRPHEKCAPCHEAGA